MTSRTDTRKPATLTTHTEDHMSTTYTLTAAEASIYDGDDDKKISRLMTDLRARFGRVAGGLPVGAEVRHPDGFVVEQYTTAE